MSLLEAKLHTGRSASALSASQLEQLGKQAAACWREGRCSTLTRAVVHTVQKTAEALSPMQVQRVVEFANTDAFLCEFRKEGAHHVVDFGDGGPANPTDVLSELNLSGGTPVTMHSMRDYQTAPEKTASAEDDDAFWGEFQPKTAAILESPESNPYSDVVALRDKIASDKAEALSAVGHLEHMYDNAVDNLYYEVKQAALDGVALGEMLQAWQTVESDPVFVKAAFDQFTPRFMQEGVFRSLGDVGDSIAKVAHAPMVNAEHPLVTQYAAFCQTLSKLASVRQYCVELQDAHAVATRFLADAIQKESAARGVKGAIDTAQNVITHAARNYGGLSEGASKALGFAATKGVLGAGALAGGVAVKHVVDDAKGAYDYRRAQRQARWAGVSGGNQ